MHTFKRPLALFMVFILILTTLPLSAMADSDVSEPVQTSTEPHAAALENDPAQTPADTGSDAGNDSSNTEDNSGIAAPAEGTPPENTDEPAGDALPEKIDESAPDAAEDDSENIAPNEEAEAPAALKFTLRSSAAPAADDCPHTNTVTEADASTLPVYKSVSDSQHVMCIYKFDFCQDCLKRISENRLVESSLYSDHLPDSSGVCTVCGYSGSGAGTDSDCDHANKGTHWDYAYLVDHTPINSNMHKVSGYQRTYCIDCYITIGTSVPAEVEEEHSFSPDVPGWCSLCGYCEHRNAKPSWLEYVSYPDHTVTQHKIKGFKWTQCPACAEVLVDQYEAEELENHAFDSSGKCTLCGYTDTGCSHKNTAVWWVQDSNLTKTIVDCNNHRTTGYQYTYCIDCKGHISMTSAADVLEHHSYDINDSCGWCGFDFNSYPHANTETFWDTREYSRFSNTQHKISGYKYTYCTDCDLLLGGKFAAEELEGHGFDSSGVCGLCGYTAEVDSLSVVVSADIVEADTGDMISATAAAAGGSGDYKYGWKVLLDGVLIRETDMGYGPSYAVYDTDAEGSYVFIVTVIDSDGNRATAQSEAISVVAHRCSFETVIVSTELKNPTQTHHDVVTTSYTECPVCHEKTDTVQTTVQEEHTMIKGSTGYEKAHPHKEYYACECGAHPYLDGEYHTANGEVQDEAVCCICHDHKYGAEEETPEGTRQKTCANCGITTVTHTHNFEPIKTEKLINPDETKHERETTTDEKCKICGHEKPGITVTIDEPHSPKDPDDYKFRDGHPHLRYAVCECGKEFDMQDEYKTANGTMQAPDVCCLCHGHVFGEPTEINAVIWKRICSVCGYEDRIAAPSQTETEAAEPPANTNEKQELKDYNIDFIKKNALGKNDIYTMFFNDDLRAEIEKLSNGWAATGYDFIDGDPAAHMVLSQSTFYVDTLMQQCAKLDPDSDTITVSPNAFKAICEIMDLEDSVIDAVLEKWTKERWTNKYGEIILTKEEFDAEIKKYDFKAAEWVGKALDIGTYVWDCLSDLSVYNAAIDGSASAIIDAAAASWANSNITAAKVAATYIEECKNPELRFMYIAFKNADLSEEGRDYLADAILANPTLKVAFEGSTMLNGALFRTNDILESNHGTYWSLQLVDELYRNLESSIAQYENISSDKNYTACMDAYSLYITYLISSYNGVLETRENYSSSLVAQLITDKDVKEKEKALNEQYKAIMEWYEFDISAAINDFSIDKVIESIRDNK